MSENRLDIIGKAIDGINEKYIDSAAESLYKNMGTPAQLTEIVPEAPTKRSRVMSVIRSAALAAAALALVIGAGLLIPRLPALSEQQPGGTTPAQTSEITQTPLSGTEQPGSEPAPISENGESIYLPLLEYPAEFDFGLFEDTFYGMWQEENGTDQINLTYYGYNSYEPWRYHAGRITRTREGIILEGMNGGMGTYLYIRDCEPDRMYLYADVSVPTLYTSDYNGVYERVTGEYEQKFDGELKTGSLTLAGRKKLKALTGFDSEYDMVTVQPHYDWYPSYNSERGCGEFYLRERTSNRIVWSAQYVSDKIYNEMDGDINVAGWCVYLTLTAELTNGEWQLTDAQWFDKSLESKGGKVWYRDLSDGHYYAIWADVEEGVYNEPKPDRVIEYYYFNGMEYVDVSWGYCNYGNSTFDVRDDKLFYLAQSDSGDFYIVVFDGEKITATERVLEGGVKYNDIYKFFKSINAIEIGDYIVVELNIPELDEPVKRTLVYDKNPIDGGFLRLINVELDEDDEGFTAEPDPEYYYRGTGAPRTVGKFHYRGDGSDSLSDMLCLLEADAKIIRGVISSGSSGADQSDVIYTKNDEWGFYPMYSCLCTKAGLDKYLKTVFTDEQCAEVKKNFIIQSGKVYGISFGTGGGNGEIGDIICEIESETEDEAVILYTAYKWDYDTDTVSDEVYDTYRVTAKKTEDGWRFDSALYEF